MRLYELAGSALRRDPLSLSFQVGDGAWSPDGRSFAVVDKGKDVVRILDASTWEVRRTLPMERFYAQELQWSPDGSKLATGDLNGKIEVWDVKRVRTFGVQVTWGWLQWVGFIVCLGMIPGLLSGMVASRGFRRRPDRRQASSAST